MTTNNPKVVFKILILGEAMVGKSCFLQRYADDRFLDTIAPTIGVDYRPVYKDFRGQLTKLMIWDTAGQEKFKSITKSFYHGAHGAVIVYDVTQRDTLLALRKWIAELKHVCGSIPIIVVGNKVDSKSNDRIPDEEASAFVDEMGLAEQHVTVSARTGLNVDRAFEILTELLMNNIDMFNMTDSKKLNMDNSSKEGSCGC